MTGFVPSRVRRPLTTTILIVAGALAARCGDVNAALGQVSEARRLSADLLVEFTKAADAANRAVMSDTDAQSISDAHEADAAKQLVDRDADALRPVLRDLGYAEESRLLEEFATRFTDYKTLDRRILDLAVENTNLKAQQLSFGPALAAADDFRDALQAAVPAQDNGRLRALLASAVAAVREIQALQAPHIAEANDATMTRLETRMTTAEATARGALKTLDGLVAPAARPHVAAAGAALERFMKVHAEILSLSRRNTNVRSLALSLDEKRKVMEPCEDALRRLQASLGRRGYPGGPHAGGR
jgi:hypothetical protein